MMPLSVMLMCSGHTSVQQRVMLHMPEPNSLRISGMRSSVVERVHLQAGEADHEARADEPVLAVAIAEHVAHVLAQEALDALPELLHAIDVFLVHAVLAVGVARLRLERPDALVLRVVPGNVRHEILDHGKRLERLHRDRLVRRRSCSCASCTRAAACR